MSDLPLGWSIEPIHSLVTINEKFKNIDDDTKCGFVPMNLVPTKLRDQVNYQLKKWAECKKGYTQFKNNDVLLAKITPCFENGKSALVSGLPNGIGAGSTEFFVLRALPATIEPKFIHAFVKSKRFVDDCTVRMSGSVGHKRVPKDYLSEYPIPVPPINEQVRIVQKLESLLSKVDAVQDRLEKIPILIKRFRKSVLVAATNGELTREWREGVETNWPIHSLKDIAIGFNYGSSAKSKEIGTVPVLRMGNLQDGKLDWEKLVYTSDESEIEKYLLEPGDVLFNRTNSPELVGKTSIYRGERKAIYAGYLIKIKCSESLNCEYLNIQLNSPHARDYCWEVKTDGVSQSNINAKKIAAYEFELPPMEEQEEIVRRVDSLFALADNVEKQYLEARKRTDRLTQSVLAKAFRGELVPQDPRDEPATKLLERIKAEREKLVKVKTKKTKRTKKIIQGVGNIKSGNASLSATVEIKVTGNKSMKLSDVPDNYLSDILTELGKESDAKTLWSKSGLSIDDFYAKLKSEMKSGGIKDDNSSPDPEVRKLKLAQTSE